MPKGTLKPMLRPLGIQAYLRLVILAKRSASRNPMDPWRGSDVPGFIPAYYPPGVTFFRWNNEEGQTPEHCR